MCVEILSILTKFQHTPVYLHSGNTIINFLVLFLYQGVTFLSIVDVHSCDIWYKLVDLDFLAILGDSQNMACKASDSKSS